MDLSPTLEKFNSPCSYAYRKKWKDRDWGIEPAALEIVRLSQIHPIAVEADIQSYFDTVPRQRLLDAVRKALPRTSLNRLLAHALKIDTDLRANEKKPLFGRSDLFLVLMNAEFQSALSPLLANFYLAPFDFVVAAHKIDMVRYADDLVLFADSMEKAQVVYDPFAKRVLQRLGLDIHPLGTGDDAKSRKRDMKIEGLECLGYRFCYGRHFARF